MSAPPITANPLCPASILKEVIRTAKDNWFLEDEEIEEELCNVARHPNLDQELIEDLLQGTLDSVRICLVRNASVPDLLKANIISELIASNNNQSLKAILLNSDLSPAIRSEAYAKITQGKSRKKQFGYLVAFLPQNDPDESLSAACEIIDSGDPGKVEDLVTYFNHLEAISSYLHDALPKLDVTVAAKIVRLERFPLGVAIKLVNHVAYAVRIAVADKEGLPYDFRRQIIDNYIYGEISEWPEFHSR